MLKGIKNKDPIPKGTIALTHSIVTKLRKLNLKRENSWYTYTIGVMLVFAWGFMLRCSEYTKTQYWDAPKINQIEFSQSKDGTPLLKFKLIRRKTHNHTELEPIAIPCTCSEFKLCTYHAVYHYIMECNKKHIKSPYLFVYWYKNNWKPFSDIRFRNELKLLLILHFGDNYDPKIHRAHGLRYGGVTDYGSIGMPLELIRRITGHAPDSKVLLLYLKLSPEAVAQLVKQKAKGDKFAKETLKALKRRWTS